MAHDNPENYQNEYYGGEDEADSRSSGGTPSGIFGFFGGLQPISDLIMRIVVGWAFYASGLTKVASSELLLNILGRDIRYPTSLEPSQTTLMLFQHEYSVPFIASDMAAQVGTAAEIVLPVLLIFGLFGRLSALGLFVFNIVAVVSYEAAQAGAGFYLHVLWGTMLLALIAHGPGKISIDYLFTPKKRRA